MALDDIQFGGLESLAADERVPLASALDASDCVVDDMTIRGRNGYRASATGAIGSGAVQGLWRYRNTPSFARTVLARGGKVYTLTDPSSETASDGAATQQGSVSLFPNSYNVSGAQLGQYLYMAGDNGVDLGSGAPDAWTRLKAPGDTLGIETLTALPAGALTGNKSSATSLAFIPANGSYMGGVTGDSLTHTSNYNGSGWIYLAGTTSSETDFSTYDLQAAQDWRSYRWLFLAASPSTQSGGFAHWQIDLYADVGGGTPGHQATLLSSFYDPPGGDGSPFCVWCDLSQLPASTLQAVRYIRFTLLSTDPGSTAALCFGGYMLGAEAPAGETDYYVTFANLGLFFAASGGTTTTITASGSPGWTTNEWENQTVNILCGTGYGQTAVIQSNTSDTLTVLGWPSCTPDSTSYFQIGSTVIQESALSSEYVVNAKPQQSNFYPYFTGWHWWGNSFVGGGQVNSAPGTMNHSITICFNAGSQVPMPAGNDSIGPFYTLSGWAPKAVSTAFNVVRLWRQTSSGLRLAKVAPITPSSTATTAFTITDDQGASVLAAENYIASGSPPKSVTAMAARGGRIVCGGGADFPARVFISSYVPINTQVEGEGGSADPFPVFPASPVDLGSDGWSFDIAPTPAEQVLAMVNGDSLYILTNQAVYSMSDLAANSTPQQVFSRGVVGRRAAIFAEESLHRVWGVQEKMETGALIWAASDGIWLTFDRVSAHELSKVVRRLYMSWFQPDSTTVLAYQDRKVYAVCGKRMLRYDTVTETWTRHNLTDNVLQTAVWVDPPPIGVTPTQAQMLQRFYFASDSGAFTVARWQPGVSFTDPDRAVTDAGGAIPAWTYSTGFDAQGQKSRMLRLYADVAGPVSISAFKDVGTTNGPPLKNFQVNGEHELAVGPVPVAYKWRLSATGANTSQLKRLMWEREPVDAHGG